MKKNHFLITACLMFFLLGTLNIQAGGAREEKREEAEPEKEKTVKDIGSSPAATAEGEKTIIDEVGRSVTIPVEAQKVVMLPMPMPSIFFSVDGSGKKIIGMHPASKTQVESSILRRLAPDLLKAETSFVAQKFEVNIEELLKLKPEVVFQWSHYPKEIEKMEAVGLPVVAIMGGGVDCRRVERWIHIAGQVANKDKRLADLLSYHHEILGMISYRLHDVPEEEKPKAMVVNIPPLQARSYKWLELTGAKNVAKDMPKWISPVNMEQVYAWNPDIIYITNFCKTQPEEILNNKLEGMDWRPISAVQKGQVYKIPMGAYRWDPPSQETPLMLLWLAKTQYPDRFADIDINEEIRKFYINLYNYDLSSEEIDQILHSPGTGSAWMGW